MRGILTQVERWRAKAEELFAMAYTVRNEIARDQLLQMAEGYGRLADHLEDLEAKRRAGRGTRVEC